MELGDLVDLVMACGARRSELGAGEKVFLAGEPGGTLYVVLSGRVSILSFGRVLEEIGPGGILGEMAVVDAGPRSAAALAAETTEVAALDRSALLGAIAAEPRLALILLRLLADRIARNSGTGADVIAPGSALSSSSSEPEGSSHRAVQPPSTE